MLFPDGYQSEFTHTVETKCETKREIYFSPGVNGKERNITKHPSDSTVAGVHNPEVLNEWGASVKIDIYF